MGDSRNTLPSSKPAPAGGCGCGASGAVRIIDVGGAPIGINRLDAIIETVRAVGLEDESRERKELLRLAKAANYIPRSAETTYEDALWREYCRVPATRPGPS